MSFFPAPDKSTYYGSSSAPSKSAWTTSLDGLTYPDLECLLKILKEHGVDHFSCGQIVISFGETKDDSGD